MPIGYLSGILLESSFNDCMVDVNGVGYELLIPLSTFDKLPRPGEKVTLFVHTSVREDAIVLYGFSERGERELFRILINVNGIGGKLALNILSDMPAPNFADAIEQNDLKRLSRINGVGKKTAERMVVELKGKLTKLFPQLAFGGSAEGVPSMAEAAADACSALEQLGFKRDQAEKAVRAAVESTPGAPSEILLRDALLALNGIK